jgi:hypothetical protein
MCSLFAHNPKPAVLTAYDWLVHLDRNLINSAELLHIHSGKPCELQHRFVQTGQTLAHLHTLPWTNTAATNAPLYRALELLATKPWGYGLPSEGRVPGTININMIWDQTVLEALLDQNASNNFTTTDVSNLYSPLLFGNSAFARTKNASGIPGDTTDETAPPPPTAPPVPPAVDSRDRPFKSLGTATFAAGGSLPNGSGLQDTILRDGATAGTPAIFRPDPAAPLPPLHPYQKAEMLRKMFNNITTTSDTYLVVMTVGYFEVRSPAPYSVTNPPVLGKEVFNEVPGDLRAKFVSVVDRSMIAQELDASGNPTNNQSDRLLYTQVADSGAPQSTPANTTAVAANLPISLTVRCDLDSLTSTTAVLFYDGRRYTFGGVATDPNAITTLIVGTGANAVAITGVTAGAPDAAKGTVVLTGTVNNVPANTQARPIAVGTAVVSGLPGNPGPQNFDVNLPRYKGVVPYFEQVEIGK